jgi:hypothetical protein
MLGLKDANLFVGIGSSLTENGDLEEGMNYLRKCLDLDPINEAGLYCMGDA